MTAHLSVAELRAFASGALTPEDLLRADDHLAECERCRDLAARANDGAGRTSDLRAQLDGQGTPHLSDDELLLFVTRRLPDDARETAARHVDACSTCAAQLSDLREWVAAPPARANWSRPAMAAAALLFVVGSLAIWQVFGRRSTAPAPSSLAGLEALPPADQTRVRSELAAGVGSLPAFANEIAPTRETLMGRAAPETAFALVAPVGTGTVSDRPRFQWQALDRADGYEVTVFDEQAGVIARSPTVAATEWSPAEPLVRDRTYVWQVTAHRAADTITAPAPPASAARFHVIGASAAERLRQMEAQYPESHVLLGLLYMEEGIVDAAAAHLRQVPPADARADVARRSLDVLAARGLPEGRP